MILQAIKSLQQHFPARKTEWLMSGLAICWGCYTIQNPAIFTNVETAGVLRRMVEMASIIGVRPESLWGGSAIGAGVVRFIALLINGAYARTPFWRAVAGFATMFIFTQVSIALWRSGVPNWGLVVYPWLVIADLLSTYRAAQDAVLAEVNRRSQKEAPGARTNRSRFHAV